MDSEQGYKGWLLTCDQHRQKQALKDAYNFLTQYIEQVYDDLVTEAIEKKLKEENKQVSLQTELKEGKKKENRLLFSIQTNVKCVIFVKINERFKQIDPVLIVDKIMEDVYVRNKDITRYCHKILPVERAFKAEHFKMLDVVDELFNQKTVPGEIRSWSLNFKLRNNSKFNYKQVLRQCDQIAAKYGHFADIYYPQWTLSIEIANHLMCMCLSQKYKEYNEYKLHKKVPKQQRPRREEKRQQEHQVEEKHEKEDHGLMTEQELRELIQKTNNSNNGGTVLQEKLEDNQNGTSQVEQQPKQTDQNQVKSAVPSKKLHEEKIVANQEDDVDLF